MWHLQVNSLVARLYEEPLNYIDQDPYIVTAQIDLLGKGIAFIHSMLKVDGKPITRAEFNKLLKLLNTDYEVTSLQSIRRNKLHTYDVLSMIKGL